MLDIPRVVDVVYICCSKRFGNYVIFICSSISVIITCATRYSNTHGAKSIVGEVLTTNKEDFPKTSSLSLQNRKKNSSNLHRIFLESN